MKNHRNFSAAEEAAEERALYRAILTLRNSDECERFFRDLCTPAELQALKDRWHVVGLLERGLSYRQIQDQTGVSVTTIGRVKRFVDQGHGGYRMAKQRLAAGQRR